MQSSKFYVTECHGCRGTTWLSMSVSRTLSYRYCNGLNSLNTLTALVLIGNIIPPPFLAGGENYTGRNTITPPSELGGSILDSGIFKHDEALSHSESDCSEPT